MFAPGKIALIKAGTLTQGLALEGSMAGLDNVGLIQRNDSNPNRLLN
jgi:hypothetical protein